MRALDPASPIRAVLARPPRPVPPIACIIPSRIRDIANGNTRFKRCLLMVDRWEEGADLYG